LALHRAFIRPSQVILVISAGDEAAPWITSAVVASARERLPASLFAREFEGEFAEGGDEKVIPREWIEQALGEPGGRPA